MTKRAFKRIGDVVQREVAGEVFLVPVRGHLASLQELFTLNEVGSWIWAHLDGSRSTTDLAGELAEEFDVDIAEAVRDTEAFMETLLEAGLAREVPPDDLR